MYSHQPQSHTQGSMSIQGHPLEITVVGCTSLKDTEWISRQDPYVCLEYGSSKYRTKTCTDGGKNPKFQEKFVLPLIEGLREINVIVWNSNTITVDDFIGSGKIQLIKVLQEGYDDTAWPLWGKTGRPAGSVQVILHYANAKQQSHNYSAMAMPVVPPPGAVPSPYIQPHVAHPSPSSYHVPPGGGYSSAPNPYSSPSPYPYQVATASAYPQQPYTPHQVATTTSVYPQQPYAPPPTTYPPPPGYVYPMPGYPPNHHGSPYPPSPYHGAYPPPSPY